MQISPAISGEPESGGADFLLLCLVSLSQELCRTSPALSVHSEFEFAEFLRDRET